MIINIEERKVSTRRHISWRNVGWAVSWLMFFGFTGINTIVSLYFLLREGYNPIAEDHPWMICMNILIVFWVTIRNKETPSEYIARWKESQGKRGR